MDNATNAAEDAFFATVCQAVGSQAAATMKMSQNINENPRVANDIGNISSADVQRIIQAADAYIATLPHDRE